MRPITKTLSKKNEKKKSEKGFLGANKLNKFIRIIRTLTSYLPFGNCYFFKAEKKFVRGNETAANEPTLKM